MHTDIWRAIDILAQRGAKVGLAQTKTTDTKDRKLNTPPQNSQTKHHRS